MSVSKKSNPSDNNNCIRTVSGTICSYVFISKYEEPFDGERELELGSEPSEIIDQQSEKPLDSNAQESLEASLLEASKESLTKHIEEREANFYFERGNRFKVCISFTGKITTENGNSSPEIQIDDVDISPL